MKTLYVLGSNDPRIKNNIIFDIKHDPNFSIFLAVRKYFNIRGIQVKTLDLGVPRESDTILCLDTPFPWNFRIWRILKNSSAKKILLAFEPPVVNPFNYFSFINNRFDKILTWNDNYIDNKKYFKFNWPQSLFQLKTKTVPFNKKKFMLLINGNKLPFAPFRIISSFGKELYSERIKAIEFFEQKIPRKFDLFGRGWNKPKKFNLKENLFGFKKYSSYRGEIDNKIKLVSNYKFNLCFENLGEANGYFTEKLFDSFKARCVPVYWGAENVCSIIPKDTFIDFRQFNDLEKLLQHLQTMDEKTYNNYIKNIEELLKNKKFISDWFEEGFASRLFKEIYF